MYVSMGMLLLNVWVSYLSTMYYMMFQLQVIGPSRFFQISTDISRTLFSMKNSWLFNIHKGQ